MPSVTQRLKDRFYELRTSTPLTATTGTKTSLIKWIHAVSKFIALIFHVQVVKWWWIFLELNSKGLYFKFEKENRCLVFTSSIKREFRPFHVVVVQWWQRNVQKSVMHVESFLLLILRWCYLKRFATTIFSATQRCNIVATLFRVVRTLFQHCNAVLRKKNVIANRPV